MLKSPVEPIIQKPRFASALRLLAGGFAFWLATIGLFAVATFVDAARRGASIAPLEVTLETAKLSVVWAVIAPLVFLWARRTARVRLSAARLSLETVLALSIAIGTSLFWVATVYFVETGQGYLASLADMRVSNWLWDVFMFAILLLAGRFQGAAELRDIARDEAHAQAQRAFALEAELAEIAGREFRDRFASHFTMNALSNILGLVRARDMDGSERAVLALSDILKRLPKDQAIGALEEELVFLDAYFAFQKIRYPKISVDVHADAAARACRIAPQTLQPLVENMFKHGMAPGGALDIRINAKIKDGRLRIDLINSNAGGSADVERAGEGLRLVKARLGAAYGARAALERIDSDGDYHVRIHAPAEASS